MKKLFVLFLATIISLSVCSCGDTENNNDTDTLATQPRTKVTTLESVTDLASVGKMDCAKVKLGDIKDRLYEAYPSEPETIEPVTDADGNEIPTTLPEGYVEEDVAYLHKTTGSNLTRFTYADLQFYTVNGKDRKGIAIMVTSSGAYGFKCNYNLKTDIINVLGTPDYEMVLPEKDSFFMLGNETADRLTYMYDEYRLDFITIDDVLSFIVLTDTDVYKKFTTNKAE